MPSSLSQRVQTDPLADLFAFDASPRAGAHVSVGNVTGDGLANLISGAGEGLGGSVRVYLESQYQSNPLNPPVKAELEPFGPSLFTGLLVG
jgi:hypothetical protein